MAIPIRRPTALDVCQTTCSERPKVPRTRGISATKIAKKLAAMVERFEELAYEHIPTQGGRVVKVIGDEVMFVVDR